MSASRRHCARSTSARASRSRGAPSWAPRTRSTRLRDLEGMAAGLASRDLFALYDRSVAHDGVFERGHNGVGALLRLPPLRAQGRHARGEGGERSRLPSRTSCPSTARTPCSSRIPPRIVGRQVTEALDARPESEDFPAYYSKARMAYAEKMAIEELPKAVLAGIRAEQERLLDSFGWTTLRVEDRAGEVVDMCGDALSPLRGGPGQGRSLSARSGQPSPSGGPSAFYDFDVRTDGEYPPDVDGRTRPLLRLRQGRAQGPGPRG